MKNKNQKGSTLIEVLGVMAVLGMASIGIYAGVMNVHSRFRLAKGYEDTKNTVKAMRDYFSAFHPTDASAQTLTKIGVFKNYFEEDGKQYSNNSYGLKTEIQLSGSGEGKYTSTFAASGDPTFRLIYHEVEPKACLDLLTADWGSDPSSGLAEISTGKPTTFRWSKDHAGGTFYALPPSLENAITACTPAEGSKSVTLYWEYFF